MICRKNAKIVGATGKKAYATKVAAYRATESKRERNPGEKENVPGRNGETRNEETRNKGGINAKQKRVLEGKNETS